MLMARAMAISASSSISMGAASAAAADGLAPSSSSFLVAPSSAPAGGAYDSAIDMARACWRRASSSSAPPIAAAASGAGAEASAAGLPSASTSMPSCLASSPSLLSSAPPSAAAASAAAAVARSCRARSSSMETRRAMASSGSMLGSIPPYSAKVSPPPPPPAAAPPGEPGIPAPPPPPPPPPMIGELTRTSEGRTPAGIVTRLHVLSPPSPDPLAASTSSCSRDSLVSCSPMQMTSMDTLFFLSWRPARWRVRDSMEPSSGLPTKTTTRWEPFLLRRCLRARLATWTEAEMSTPDEAESPAPRVGTPWRAARIFPMSSVGLTRSSAPVPPLPGPDPVVPAMAMTPTVDSGLDCVLALTSRLAASCCASIRVGM
mmetsp:Transcript_2871/g.6592  ORF Transcript_2871/g.6592 Transcript_2871/m.6592 type:complete len:374 (+) Transcript_2871:352-1473(+)